MTIPLKPKVYITQEVQTANYGPAEGYGEVVFVTASELSHLRNSAHNRKLIALIREKLRDFRPHVDFVAPSGSPIITGLVFAVLRERTARYQVLKWNARDQMYVPLFIDIEETEHVQ